jgi:monothiol glutaredoxin
MTVKFSLPIANADFGSASAPSAPKTRAEGGDVMSEIRREITENRVFLYMKGTPEAPMCGFSARVAQILGHLEVPYGSCNILADGEKREAVKVFGNWPTIPQLYVNGELVGGCDIVTEMFQAGELQELLGVR